MKFVVAALAAGALVATACGEPERPPTDDGDGPSDSDGASGGSPGSDDGGGAGGEGGQPPEPASGVCEGVVCPGPGQRCVEAGESARCECAPGESCAAVNECEGTPCDAHATCVDFEDGFRCDCDEDFSGNGFVCVAGNPCAGVVCEGLHEICRPAGDQGVCGCKFGYEASAQGGCVNVDECTSTATCAPNSDCIDFEGGYRCDCRPGYATVANSCVDVDECVSGLAPCDAAHGLCSDGAAGGFECTCEAGSYGDGFFCKETDDCASAPCQNDGSCLNTPTGFLCVCPLGTSGGDCSDVVQCSLSRVVDDPMDPLFPDATLATAVRNASGVPPGEELTVAQLSAITELRLDASSGTLTSLAGLECLASLRKLSLRGQPLTELSPLGQLGGLQELDLSCSVATDLTPLVPLVGLQRLTISNDPSCPAARRLSDLEFARGLSGLESLEVAGHDIADLAPLTSLGRLRRLDVAANQLTDLAPLEGAFALAALNVSGNELDSIAPVAGLLLLKHLAIGDTQTASLASLAELRELLVLSAPENAISGAGDVGELRNLRALDLTANQLSDLSEIASLERLSETRLSSNPFDSLAALVAVPTFGQQGTLWLSSGQLDCPAEAANVAALERRGVTVVGGCP